VSGHLAQAPLAGLQHACAKYDGSWRQEQDGNRA